MNFLFVHNSFPAQFIHAARALAADPSNKVAAIGWEPARPSPMRSIKLVKYSVPDGDVSATHPFARRFDFECRRAEQVMYAMVSLHAGHYCRTLRLGRESTGARDLSERTHGCLLRV